MQVDGSLNRHTYPFNMGTQSWVGTRLQLSSSAHLRCNTILKDKCAKMNFCCGDALCQSSLELTFPQPSPCSYTNSLWQRRQPLLPYALLSGGSSLGSLNHSPTSSRCKPPPYHRPSTLRKWLPALKRVGCLKLPHSLLL